jgi:hypothetical protein
LIRNPEAEKPSDNARLFVTRAASENHLLLLEQFVTILPYILPASDIARPTLMHHDLHLDNVFVDGTDPTKISSIIDWQAAYASPLFLQARFPSVFDCDDPYPWGAVQPSLPKNFDTLSPAEKEAARETLARLRLKKFYEMASRKFNPILFTAMDATSNHNDPTSFVFHIIGQSAFDGPVPLEELLIQIYEQWDRITERKGLNVPCPLSFTEEEIKDKRQQAQEWANVYGEFESLRAGIAGKDGWVSHYEYEEAMRIFKRHQGSLEILRERLEQLS